MTEAEIDAKVREHYNKIIKSAKTDEQKGKCIDSAVDLYFKLKAKKHKQLSFDFCD